MFPGSMFPPAMFPPTMFPGSLLPSTVETYTPVIFEIDLETYLAGALGAPVWADQLPASITKAQLPAIVYALISSDSEETLDGPDSIDTWSFDFSAYGSTRRDAATLIERLRSKILGYVGMMGATEVLNVTLENQLHGFEVEATKSGLATHKRVATYSIQYRNSIPSFA